MAASGCDRVYTDLRRRTRAVPVDICSHYEWYEYTPPRYGEGDVVALLWSASIRQAKISEITEMPDGRWFLRATEVRP